ncbi:uncharacterized protein LOC141849545 isoform X1 [Brevipalpus obovatus]|uniref:uncharacterized protein LOC141849545 isoform X1 n=1 Tax=Brevipalpus obovatus TaxID=246614 RepID=UPI003D9EEC16
MPLMRRCCFMTIKGGSYLSAFYTVLFYTVIFMISTVNFNTVPDRPGKNDQNEYSSFAFIISCLIFLSVLAIIASIIMLLGISGYNDSLLVPWMISILLLTILEVITIVFILTGGPVDPIGIVWAVLDFFICMINILALACVGSLYVEIRKSKSSEFNGSKGSVVRPDRMDIPSKEDMSKEYLLSSSPQRLTITSQTEDDNKSSTSYLSVIRAPDDHIL